MAPGAVRAILTGLVAVAVLGAVTLSVAGPAAAADGGDPYFTHRFTATVNPFTFGQDPTWTADGRVLSNEPDPAGVSQVYVSQLDGSAMSCLTCGQPGPNGFPEERPEGDWILFCSFRGQSTTFGAPCLGGYGTDLYLMRPDGSEVTRLTGPGSAFESDGNPYDNYHPYWSPDGRHLVWTHVDYRPLAAGGTRWTILVATVRVGPDGAPSLSDITSVAPGGDHAYETQAWSPDGSGFLYTALSSGGNKHIGWLNTELYLLRLYGHGASLEHPQVTHLTDGSPAWDEQAVFTPDGRDVIWMSSRGTPTWYQTVVTAAQAAGYDPPDENDVVGPFFVLTVLDPKFRTDLYELDRRSGAVRRLTDLGQVIPEFTFDPGGTRLVWTTGDHSRTYVGTFASIPSRPVGRVGSPDPRWIGAPRRGDHTRPLPEHATAIDLGHVTVPPQELSAFALLESQLGHLSDLVHGLPQGGSCCQAGP